MQLFRHFHTMKPEVSLQFQYTKSRITHYISNLKINP
jgi:hypothetical protein